MISVIIPTYNRSNTIRKSVESVLKQTYTDTEVIIVDDGSTDDTRQVVEEIDDRRIRYHVLDKNSGACAARNKGIELARGEYIAFHDSDDIWHANKLEDQLEKLLETQCDVVICRYMQHYKSSEKIIPGIEGNVYCDIEMALVYCLFSTPCIMGKTYVFKDILFDTDLPRLQDYDLGIRICENYKVFYMDDILRDAYIQDDSISQNWKNLCIAQTKISDKYKPLFLKYKRAGIMNLKRLIKVKAYTRQNCNEETKELMKLEPSVSSLIKFCASRLGLIHIYYANKYDHISNQKF